MSDSPLAEVLRARGLRLTAQRQLVLEAVHQLGHGTPEQVHTAVREVAAGVNITTIYRTLELLEELGLVTHTHLSHGSPTYHSVTEQHVHLVCRVCGWVDELAPALLGPLASDLERERGFRMDIGHVALFGVCREHDGLDPRGPHSGPGGAVPAAAEPARPADGGLADGAEGRGGARPDGVGLPAGRRARPGR